MRSANSRSTNPLDISLIAMACAKRAQDHAQEQMAVSRQLREEARLLREESQRLRHQRQGRPQATGNSMTPLKDE